MFDLFIMTDCAICLNGLNCKSSLRNKLIVPRHSDIKLLTCNHGFHSNCLKQWWYKGSNWAHCPCCRSPIQFKRLSYSYNHLLISRKIKETLKHILKPYVECQDKYIYYDMPLMLLFIDKFRNALHFASCLGVMLSTTR